MFPIKQSNQKLSAAALLCFSLAACQSTPTTNTSEPAAVAVNTPATTGTETESASKYTARAIGEEPDQISEPVIITSVWERIRRGLALQDEYFHPAVESQLNTYRGNQRYFDLVSERARPFLFTIVNEIEQRGLPMELALLPMVESTFNPSAYSRENAVGLWQFVSNTGRSFGLQQDWWYDARRDPFQSTRAALEYLTQLYTRFDEDWLLALAAYNTGGGNVNRAIRRNGESSAEFWDLHLASETRSHVPKLLALSRIIQNPDSFEIELPEIENEEQLAFVEIGTQIDLARVADLIDMDNADLRALNPGYLQWATHPDSPQNIAVPMEKKQLLVQELANLDQSEFVTWEHYQIRSGDTLGAIARRLNTRVDVLQTVNKLRGTQIIAGRALLIPRGSGAGDLSALPALPTTGTVARAIPASYTIRPGDNLWTIARRFNLRSTEIAAWNSLSLDALLHPGQTLDLSFAQQELANTADGATLQQNQYMVMRGDNPANIADRFDIELNDVLQWNGLTASSIIYPGQLLYVSPPQARLN